jgi:glycosyltransferase involved in cell wall biosynthesis
MTKQGKINEAAIEEAKCSARGSTGHRVCMVAYTIYETDNRVMRYAETLAARGDHVDVIALRQEGQTSKDVIKGVNVFRIQRRTFQEKTKASYLGKILLFWFRAMVLLTGRQMGSRYDLIHVHSVPDFLVFVAWLPKFMGCRIILDIHDVLPEFYASKFQSGPHSLVFKVLLWVEHASAAFADHVIVSNGIWREKLVSRCVGADKCTAILNFPDRSIFRGQGKTRAGDIFIILYPGTLNWHQGVDIAIRAFALIKDEAPKAEFHIYGVGRTKDSLIDLTRQLGLQEQVLFRDPLPLREIAAVMENADLGVVPKRSDSFGNEAFSTKILEFMAVRVPVVVSDTKIDRYYFDESMVKFFRNNDENDLARSMLLMMQRPEVRQNLVQNAWEFVTHNDWNTNSIKYLTLVDRLDRYAG